MRSSDEKYARKILEDTKNTQERKIKKSFTGPYESEGRGFESLPAHQEKQRLNVKFVAAFLFVFEVFLILGAYLALTEFLDTLLSMSTTRKKDYLQPKLHHRRNDCLWWSFPLPLIYLIGSIISSVLS